MFVIVVVVVGIWYILKAHGGVALDVLIHCTNYQGLCGLAECDVC